jgi:hypothetical protein
MSRIYVCGLVTEAEIFAILYLDNSGIDHGAKERGVMMALMGAEAAMDLMPRRHDYNAWGGGGGSYIFNFAGVRYVDGTVKRNSPPPELHMRVVLLEILHHVCGLLHNTNYKNLLGILEHGVDSGNRGVPMFSAYHPGDVRNTRRKWGGQRFNDGSVDCAIILDCAKLSAHLIQKRADLFISGSKPVVNISTTIPRSVFRAYSVTHPFRSRLRSVMVRVARNHTPNGVGESRVKLRELINHRV